jgi:hypothetical protein
MSAPFEDYLAIQAANISTLSNLEPSTGGSPAWYRHCMDNPIEDRPAFVQGRATHTAVLEPEEFKSRYTVLQGSVIDGWREIAAAHAGATFDDEFVVWDELTGKGEPYKVRTGPKWSAFARAHGRDPRRILLPLEVDEALRIADHVGDCEILAPAQRDTALLCAAAVHASPDAMAAIRGARYEETVSTTDPVTGLAIKGRLDIIKPTGIGDLKTTSKPIGPLVKFGFTRQATDLLYHAKVVWYHDLAVLAGKIPQDADPPDIIAIEVRGTFVDVGWFPLSREAVDAGRRTYRRWLNTLSDCIAADYWPGAAPGRNEWTPEGWAAGMEE